jgi:nicotinate-nucleotide adenylyltransferase
MAHLVVAETVREALDLDLVLFAPASQQPLKGGRSATPAEERTAMVELAIRENPHFVLSRVDLERPGPSYTVDSLRHLRDEWGPAEKAAMWFIIGADSLLTFPRWRDPQGIVGLARLAVVRRPGSPVEEATFNSELPELGAALDWVDAPLLEISGTDIRHRIAEGRSIRYLVPEEVREYIEANGLYR